MNKVQHHTLSKNIVYGVVLFGLIVVLALSFNSLPSLSPLLRTSYYLLSSPEHSATIVLDETIDSRSRKEVENRLNKLYGNKVSYRIVREFGAVRHVYEIPDRGAHDPFTLMEEILGK
jgi:hypothetical protein